MAARYTRRKMFHQGEDRISHLPDNLRIQVLSFLPTKQVVRASILSTRWLGLWKNVPAIDLVIGQDEARELVTLDKVLALHTAPKINKLRLSVGSICIREGLSIKLDSIVRSAVERHVEDMALCFFPTMAYTLPWEVYTCRSLKELMIAGCWFSPSQGVLQAWTSLRVLDVSDVTWSNDMVACVLAGLPALESLRVRRFRGITRVRTFLASNLKELVMDHCLDMFHGGNENDGSRNLSIWASHLQVSKLLGEWLGLRPWFINALSVTKVELGFEMKYSDNKRDMSTVGKILQMVRQCEQLTLGLWYLEVLAQVQPDSDRASFCRLKCLVINTGVDLDLYLPGLRYLFSSSPMLERLAICFHYYYKKHGEFRGLCPTILEPLCGLLPNVKIVELRWLGELWFNLAECLLKNLPMLEKMVIHGSPCIRGPTFLEFTKSLLASPRASPRAVVIIH